MTATASKISEDIASLDRHVEALQSQADAIALDAVSGDEAARKSLAGLLRDIAQIKSERPLLCTAREQAKLRHIAAQCVIDAADRSRHMDDASHSATRLVDLARCIDAAQASLLTMLREVASTERAIWTSLRLAGESPTGVIVGQRDLAGLATERLSLASQRRTMFASDQRGVEEVARIAWAHLIISNHAEEAA